jgi:hypothetical protein
MSKMFPLDLKAMLASEKANALAAISAAQLLEERADAMDYYLGDMRKDMPAQDGRSRAVSTGSSRSAPRTKPRRNRKPITSIMSSCNRIPAS